MRSDFQQDRLLTKVSLNTSHLSLKTALMLQSQESAFGTKRTFRDCVPMSAFGGNVLQNSH
jgi:hypothetical protein